MKHPMTSIPSLVLAALLSTAAVAAQTQPSPPATMAVEKTGVNAAGTTAANVRLETMTATVEAIDQATRMVTLLGPDGSFTLQVSEQARNLGQVKVGDKVTVEYYEGLVAEMAPPGTPPNKVTLTDAMGRAAPGERPAAAVGTAVTATVTIEHVDSLRHTVFFKGPLGKMRVVKAMKPEFRTMLKKLKPGDQVNLTYFEAMAVSVKAAGK